MAREHKQPGVAIYEAPFVLFVLDRTGIVTLSEGDASAAFEIDPGNAIGKSAFEIYHDYPHMLDNIRRALAGETFAEIIEAKDHTFDAHYHPLHTTDGDISGMVGLALDITRYRQSEERYRQLFEGITDICFVIDREWRYTHANQATARVTTWEENQLIGRRLQDILPQIEDGLPFQVYRQVMQTGLPRRFTSQTLTLPGSLEGVFEVMVYPVPEGIMCIAHDVTERAKTEQALRESEAKYHALFEELRDACFMVSLHGKFMGFNHAMLDLFGYSRQELQQLHPKELYVNPADRVRYQEEIELIGFVRDYAIHMRKKSGEVMDCLVTASLWRDADGNLKGYQGIIRDITLQKRTEEALQKSNTLLDALNRVQSKFMVETEPEPPFQRLLDTILELTGSNGGFISEVVHSQDTSMAVKTHAIRNAPWLDAAHAAASSDEVELRGQSSLFSAIAESGQLIISNDPAADPCWGPNVLEGSAPQSFLGLPFHSRGKLVGILGIADRQGGYDESLVLYLRPLLSTCASILERYKSEFQRQETEKALRESEERYRLLVESAPVPLFVHAAGKVLYANDACARLLNARNAAALIEQPVSDFTHPDCRKAFKEPAKGQAKTAANRVQKITRLNGTPIDVNIVATPITYHNTPATQVIIHDITERVRAEQAEREQRVLAEALRDTTAAVNSTLELDQVLDLILANAGQVVPHDASTIMMVDAGIARVVGHRGYSERGTAEVALAVRFDIAETTTLRTMSESRQPLIISDVQECADWIALGMNDWVRSYAGAPIILDGDAIGFINLDSSQPSFYTPIHAERLQTFASQAAMAIRNARLYEAIRRHAADLEASNNELEAYSHTVAHDLKAPLHIVIGYASLLTSDYIEQLEPEVMGHANQIEIYAHKMNDMIENLLLLARLRDATTTITTVQIRPFIQAAVDRFRQRIEERGVAVTVEPDLPDVMGYGPWLEEVFANLIENAIKYCGPNNPAPRITIRGKKAGDSRIRYEVADNGLGVAPEHQEHLFKMFTRFHAGYTRGAGLGLSIVNRIVNKLGGEVGVESAPNEGSTFWFTLSMPPDG
ncbi:MAG: PAS domain S-box protein [Anaerolineae bacterium]|nr:PAS domain S-box protein [Anaerolineae bacterium]